MNIARIIAVATLSCLIVAATQEAGMAQNATGLQWAAGPAGTVNSDAALATTQVMRQADFPVYSVNSGGTIDSLIALSSGDVALATIDGPTMRKAWEGAEGFQKVRGFGQILSGFTNFIFIIIPADSPIRSAADLQGKTINSAPPGALLNVWIKDLTAVLEAENVVLSSAYKVSQFAFSDSVDAMNDGRIHAQLAYTFAGKLPGWLLQAMARGNSYRILPMSKDVHEAMVARGWQPSLENAWDELSKLDSDVRNIEFNSSGVSTVIVASDATESSDIYKFLKTFFDKTDDIAAAHPINGVYKAGPAYGIQYLSPGIPVNAGAAEFFKEAGVWRDELTVGSQ